MKRQMRFLLVVFFCILLWGCGKNTSEMSTPKHEDASSIQPGAVEDSGEIQTSYESQSIYADGINESNESKYYSETKTRDLNNSESATTTSIGAIAPIEEKEAEEDILTSTTVYVPKSLSPEETDFTDDEGEFKQLTWEEFQALPAEAQDAYLESFEDVEAFYLWMMDAQSKSAEQSSEVHTIGADGIIEINPTE